MLYTGRFKNRNEETIQVNIITNNNTSQETELKFVDESPVVIVQNSSDGIFSPIKSRSCTITIVANEPYYDMYSGTSHGTKVTVNNLGTGECLFYGYLTPCEYNQPLLYLNEIELEAVDAVSTLQDFKYEFEHGNYSSIRTISNIVKYCLVDIAGYTGKIMVPATGIRARNSFTTNHYPFEIECISEEILFDDDEGLTCYEILEEICNTYCLSLVPYGDDVYFVDYEGISKYGQNIIITWQQYNYDNYLPWKDLVTNSIEETEIEKILSIDDYSGDDQNIELDEVYNKISIKADITEVEEEDIIIDPFDYADKSTYYNAVMERWAKEKSGDIQASYEFVCRFFEFRNPIYLEPYKYNGNWKTPMYTNCHSSINSYFVDNFIENEGTFNMNALAFKYELIGSAFIFNTLFVGQACVPSQKFNYESSKAAPSKADWSNILIFTPQSQWMQKYYSDNGGITIPNGISAKDYWLNDFYENHMGGTNPVLTFESNRIIYYTSGDNDKTNYLVFNGNLLWEVAGKYGDNNIELNDLWWLTDSSNNKYNGMTTLIKDLGVSDTITAEERGVNDVNYNKGWPMLKIKLQIGDKYWNGTNWTTTESTAWINYHKEDLTNLPSPYRLENELLVFGAYNKPVRNFSYAHNINEEGYAIPLNSRLVGKLKLSIYMPKIPWVNDLIKYSNGMYNIDYTKTGPFIYMEDLSLKLVSANNDNYWWKPTTTKEEEDNDDVIYSNIINSNNVTEFDDLSLKINSYNNKKPLSKSMIFEHDNKSYPNTPPICPYICSAFYNPLVEYINPNTTTSNWPDAHPHIEDLILNKYVSHYNQPKKIYNCEVHGYYKPWNCVRPDALDNIKMIVDEQEYDVKANTNELKLIEY